jgi:hypothetical protein
MLTTLLKHAAVEVAIHVFFDKLGSNFTKPKIRKIGCRYWSVESISVPSRQYMGPPIVDLTDIRHMHGIDIQKLMLETIRYEMAEENIKQASKELSRKITI